MNNTTVIVIFVLIAGFLLSGSIFTVDEREYVLKLQFGRVVKTDYEPGLHFKIPFAQNIRKFDNRILTLDQQPEQMNTREQKYVDVDYFAKWHIVDVTRFYTATQGQEQVALNRMTQIFNDGIRDEFAQRTLREVVSEQRREIMERMVESANLRVDELGIEIVDVRIKQIGLTDRVTDSVFDRMATQRTEFANELRSLGREKKEEIEADADRQVRVLLAEAQRDADTIRGEGDAESTRIYAEAYSADEEFYAFYRSLQAYDNAFSDADDVLVIDPESEFFKYFKADGLPDPQ